MRCSWLRPLAMCLSLAASACLGPAPAVAPSCCTQDSDCADSHACVDGVCSARCVTSDTCAVGEICSPSLQACIAEQPINNPCSPGSFGTTSSGGTVTRDAAISDATMSTDVPVNRRDAGSRDRFVEEPDAGEAGDASLPDANLPADASQSDASQSDGSQPDASRPDASRPDASLPDAARPDASPRDASQSDRITPTCSGLDGHEPNNAFTQARPFIGPDLRGATCDGDQDWFTIPSVQGDRVEVRIEGPGAEGALFELWWAGVPPQPIATGVTIPGGQRIIAPSVPGPTMVRVTGFDATQVLYVMNASWGQMPGCMNDGLEPNDAQTQARPFNGQVNAQICPMDRDWFQFSVPATGGDVTVELSIASGAADLDLMVQTPDGRQLLSSNPAGMPESIALPNSAGGRYFLQVFGRGGASSAYQVNVHLAPVSMCSDDSFEPNDSPSAASTTISSGTLLSGTLCPSDPDHYRVRFDQGGAWSIHVSHTPMSILRARLMDLNGSVLMEMQDAGGDFVMPVSVMASTTLILGLELAQGTTADMYTVQIRGTPPTCSGQDAHEPNNTRTAARPYVAPGMSGNTCGGDEDWFRIDSLLGETVTASLAGADPVPDVFEAYNANGNRLGSAGPLPGGGRGMLLQNVPGAVYFRILRSDTRQSSYTLQANRVSSTNCLPDNFEPNETQATARPYTGPLQAQICAGDLDHFWVEVTAGSQINVQLLPDPMGGDIDIRLLAPNGSVIATSQRSAGQPENISTSVMQAGRYTLQIYGWPENSPDAGQAAYLLSMDVQPGSSGCMDDGFEPNDNPQNATQLSPGDVEAHLCNNNRDMYAFFMDQSGSVELSLGYMPPPRMRLTLLSATQQVIQDAAGGMGQEFISADLQPGVYFVRIQAPPGPPEGRSYVLSLRRTGMQCVGDQGEPDDDPSASRQLTTMAPLGGVVCAPDDIDHVWFNGTAGRAIELTLDSTSNFPGTLDAVIFDDMGQVVGQTEIGMPAPQKIIRADIRRTARHFVQVFNSLGFPEPSPWRLTLRNLNTTLCVDDSHEENDGRAQARDIMRSANDSTSVFARACPLDQDWYAFQLRANVPIRIQLSGGMVSPPPQLVVYDPTGENPVASGNPIDFRPTVSGRYLVQVDFSGTDLPEAGTAYTLQLSP